MSEKHNKDQHHVSSTMDLDEKEQIVHLEISQADTSQHNVLIEEALSLVEEESKMGLWQIFKMYYPGALFGLGLSLALVMEGYDTGLINNFFGQSTFKNRFGVRQPDGTMAIPSDWQAGVNNAASGGQILGLLINGWAQTRFGYRTVYMVGQVAMAASIFVLFFAVNIEMILVGNLLAGIPWGIFQVITTAYASEIVPPALRGFLTTFVSMCWGTGAFLAAGILRGTLDLPGDGPWKIPYGLQWIWPVPLFLIAWLAPESPFYLVRKDRIEEARAVIRKIARPGHRTERMIDAQIEIMKQANEMERINAAQSSYRDCFRGVNTKRTIIGLMCWLIQQTNGETLTSYATIFLQRAGMAQTAAFTFNMGIQSVNMLATGLAMWLIGKVGRRPLYLSGIGLMGLFMLVIGIIGCINTSNQAMAIGAMLVVIRVTFKITLGPCCYTIVAETPSSRVRGQTMVIGRAGYVAGGIIMNQLKPRMLNADGWNWGAKSGFFFLGFDIAFFIYLFFYLPETRNRTTAEIEYMFQAKIPCRKFKSHVIDPAELAEVVETERAYASGVDHRQVASGLAAANDAGRRV